MRSKNYGINVRVTEQEKQKLKNFGQMCWNLTAEQVALQLPELFLQKQM